MIGDATVPRGAAAATGLGRVEATPARCAGLGFAACRCGAVMRTGGNSCGADGGAACASAELGINIAEAIPTVVLPQAAFERPATFERSADPIAMPRVDRFPMMPNPLNAVKTHALAPLFRYYIWNGG